MWKKSAQTREGEAGALRVANSMDLFTTVLNWCSKIVAQFLIKLKFVSKELGYIVVQK